MIIAKSTVIFAIRITFALFAVFRPLFAETQIRQPFCYLPAAVFTGTVAGNAEPVFIPCGYFCPQIPVAQPAAPGGRKRNDRFAAQIE